IGTIGAGQASRALVRLSNGRVLTLRIGDRINGGAITAIGDSRITYQKNGQAHALGVLNGQ
ncbi:MAG: pilus assembly protein PilP, partial [Paracoccus sp. (in: a-proteobacteria)]|nr:pilus assembly protein PilP [Paracoccus sp. (in: a-proteobacteria)]